MSVDNAAENDRMPQCFHSIKEDELEHAPQSRPGSISHPYRSIMMNGIFPRCHLLGTPPRGPESYARPLTTLGHGFALWDAVGRLSMARKRKHLQTGINVGDVGYLDPEAGEFAYLFNIFADPTDEIQIQCPPGFEPLSPPGDVIRTEGYFSPGTILASEGVTISRLKECPLDVEFTVQATVRESSLLILPDGASREDLVSTDLVRKFVAKNALSWYRFINRHSDVGCPNGQLFVITGCDKGSTYACLNTGPTQASMLPSARFQDGRWTKKQHAVGTRSDHVNAPTDKCTVIVRGMQVAVRASDWVRYIFQNETPSTILYYELPSVPNKGPLAKWQAFKMRYLNYQDKSVSGDAKIVQFHPLSVLSVFLIQECPEADVAIVEDAIWCPYAHECDGSITDLVRMFRKIIEDHDILHEDGLLTLVRHGSHLQETSTSRPTSLLLRLFNPVSNGFHARRRRWSIARKLAKSFPGPGPPRDLLSY